MLKKSLQSPEQIRKDTTLLTSLLLDIFEKITDELRSGISWTSHVNGALALVRLRSLGEFQGRPSVRLLMRLTTNLLISCVASELPVPHELCVLRAHISNYIDDTDPKWQLSDVMVHYANFRHSVLRGRFSPDECFIIALDLDQKLHKIYVERPPPWQYRSTVLEWESERAYNRRFDSYPDRHITQTCNVLRSIRILLNEAILQHYSRDSTNLLAVPVSESLVPLARDHIRTLTGEICASVPQYVDCSNAIFRSKDVQQRAASSTHGSDSHAHSPGDNLDCYTLIFPLYVCGSSKHSPVSIRPWVTRQLRHMGSHFGIRNARMVADVLEKAPDTSPWSIYAMLGGYAFAA
ncbi:hypothetical protein NFIA_023270 [Paecilomyces variotii No. 5]|uniref:C6 transcription factor n=1 Tax=Byssochlamys spectabilis (strain No. 5 / NBRC 109023) TaxID=1356009 RepID=V5FPH2_BYSSN|nr:hypothetical protein NFIA_023270 [Paecilomyces variotii No. 5]